MSNSQEASQPNNSQSHSEITPQKSLLFPQDEQDFFCFLGSKELPLHHPRPFFSENGLSHDIIQVTNAEPDVCLEVFYALYNTLWPQLEKLNERKNLGREERQRITSLQDAWTKFIGGATFKGVLCPPEKLIGKKKPGDIKKFLSQNGGEKRIFQNIDGVISSISHLREKIIDYPDQLLQKEEIITSLDLIESFYQGYRDQVKALGLALIEALSVEKLETSMNELVDLLEPKSVMMSDIFLDHWAYRISRSKAQKLLSLDETGCNLPNDSNEPSNHRVAALPEGQEPLVYFKANGNPVIQPEKEYKLYSLFRQLQIPVPETALLVLADVFENNSNYFYAVQASEAVTGKSALEACCKNEEIILEQEAYALQVIGTILTNPSDGSFKNFKYSPQYKSPISIDNDLVFKPEFTADRTVNVKSILYLLPQMNLVIPKSITTFFTTLDSNLTILSWLKSLHQKNQEYNLLLSRLAFQNARCIYQNLLPADEVPILATTLQQKILVDPMLYHDDHFCPQILISERLLHNILEKLQIIEKKLLQNDSVSSQVLFEEVSPILGKYYRKLRVEFADPEEALDALWGHKKNGIDYSEIHSLLDPEELDDFFNIKDDSSSEDLLPEVFFSEYRSKLASGKTPPLDKFVQYQSLRKRKNLFNISQALQELQLLIQKGLTGSQSPRDILDFCHSLDANDHMAKKIIDLFSNISHPELRWLFTLEKYFKRDIPVELRPFSLTLNGAFMKQRTFLLSESQKKSLLDDQGMIWKHPFLTGRSSVNCFPAKNPEFYLKQNPEWPGYELASILFMRAIGITHLPHQDLVIINSNSQYPVLLTQAVQGIPVCKVWKKPNSFDNLDPFHTGLLIIAAILINPEDGKEDNFILSEDGKYLIPIDNDHCFLPSTFQKGKFWNMIVNTALQTKTLLFCLDRMKEPVPHEVKQHILSLDFDSLLTSWMQELVDLDDRLYHLVDEQQRKAFLENGTVLKIPFYLQFIHNLYWKVHKIQDLLRSSSELSPFDLLKAVEPFAAKCYQGSFQPENNTLEKRFMAATNELYIDTMRGSRVSILNTQLMMNIVNAPVKGHVDDVTYHEVRPSEALKVLKKLIQTQIQNRKLQKDLICELDNPKEETLWTTLFGRPLLEKNLKDFFVNPKEGLVLQGSKLITGINLQSWFSETPEQGAKIKFLSLPNSPLLDSKAIKALVEGCPNLGYLNVSGCTNLEEIVTAKGEWPLLTRLEAKNCLKLKKMVSWSPIKILRVGTHQELFEILVENHVLEIFAISTQTNQFDFYLMFGASFQIKSLQKDQTIDSFLRSALTDQVWFENFFKSPRLTIGTHSILAPKDLAIFITQLDLKISTIDFKAFQEMVRWNFKNLKVLELPFFRGAGTKFFEALAQGDWPKLTLLNLTYFEVDDEGLAFLSQGNWPLLEIFTLGESKATKKGFLNFVASPNLFNIKEITFSSIENPIAKTPDILFPKHWHMLEELDLSSSEIVQIEIEIIVYKFFWPNLKNLNLSNTGIDDNAFGVLSQGNWPLLEKLNLFATKITYKSLLNFYSNNKWPKLKFKEFSLPSHIDLNLARSLHEKTFQGERLEFANLELGLAEITLLVKKYQFKGLKYLDLSNNKLFDEGISLLSLAKWSSLEDLNVENVNFTSKSIDNIVRKSKWKKLKSLKLSNNQISDDGISSFTLVNWPQLEKLNVQNTNIAFKEVSTPLKWGQLKYLNISNNAISDEGLLFFATGEWPVLEELGIENIQITEQGADILVHHANLPLLKKLDISQNIIGDEGLKTLASAKWPNFQHLVYYETKVTLEGNIAFLKSIQWSNLSHLEHSLVESFYSLDEPSNICYTTETVLAVVPRDNKRDSILVTVLDATWLDSKEINLSLRHKGTNRDVLLLPKDTLHEFEEISFSSFSFSVIGFAIWPKNLKKLEITDLSLSGPDTLERLFSRQCPLLEDLNLENTAMTTRCIEILVIKSDWPFLKKLCISRNKILDEGLKFLISEEWPLIESLNLRDTGIAEAGIGSIAKLSKWPKLKTLDISDNSITDKGLKLLSSGKWLELENLYLKKTLVTTDGIESMINLSEWPNLHTLDISHNLTYDKGLQILSSKKWLKLKNLSLRNSSIPVEGIKGLVEKFPSLQSLDLSDSNISHQGLVLLSSGKWPLFESLTLKNTLTSGEGIKSLAGLSNWPNLKVLDVSNNSISDTGIKLLSSAKWLLLENLNISQTDVTSVGISHIIQAANWPNLKILDVSSNSLSEGIKFLSSGKWPLLENLNIQQTNISFSGIKQMIEAAKWSNLKEIHIQADPNSKTALAVEQLISAKWPECKMYASQ